MKREFRIAYPTTDMHIGQADRSGSSAARHLAVAAIGLMTAAIPQTNSAAAKPAQNKQFECQQDLNYEELDPYVAMACQSIFPQLGGLRQSLSDRGIEILTIVTNNLTYDVSGAVRDVAQAYDGQIPSYKLIVYPLITYDLSRVGFNDGAKIKFSPYATFNTFDDGGIDSVFIGQIAAQLPLFDGRFVVQAGYYPMISSFYDNFLDLSTGTNLLSPQGPLLLQVGVDGFKPAPGIDFKLYSQDKRFYTQFGVSRSISPLGLFADADQNRSGLSFSVDGAKAVLINEVGYKLEPSANTKKVWLRAGAIYNTSNYVLLNDPTRTGPNCGFYAVADFQLTQPYPDVPMLGWYLQAKFSFGREDVNPSHLEFGGTLQKLGTFEWRPTDIFSLELEKSYYSQQAIEAARATGLDPASNSLKLSASYAYELHRGMYLTSGLSYITNPTFEPKRDDAVNLVLSLSSLF